MHVKYLVERTEAERESLQALASSGSRLARKVKRAQILLAADQGYRDKDFDERPGGRRVHSAGQATGELVNHAPTSMIR